MSVENPSGRVAIRTARKFLVRVAIGSALAVLVWRVFVQQFAARLTVAFGAIDYDQIRPAIWIAIGSALGGVARFWCAGAAARLVGDSFPWGTIAINVFGSFVIGLFGTLTGPDGRFFVSPITRQFVMIGICGGYTTFSAFSLQTLNLFDGGDWVRAAANVGASVVLCLAAVWAGHSLAQQFS